MGGHVVDCLFWQFDNLPSCWCLLDKNGAPLIIALLAVAIHSSPGAGKSEKDVDDFKIDGIKHKEEQEEQHHRSHDCHSFMMIEHFRGDDTVDICICHSLLK